MSDFNIKLGVKLDEQSLRKIKSDLGEVKVNITLDPSNITKQATNIKSRINSQMSDIGKSVSSSINQNLKLDSTKLTADINTLRNNIKLFLQENKTLSVETKNSVNALMNNLNNVNSAKGLTTIRAQYKEIQSSAKLAGETGKRSFEQMELEAKKFTSSQITLSSKIDDILNSNTKLTAAYREQYEVLKKRNLEATDKKEISSINAEVNALTAQAKAAGLLGNTWSSEIKNILSQFKGMFSAVAIFSTLKSGVQTSFNEILSLDDAMVELKKVCDSTNASFEEFYYSSNGMAKSLGQTTEAIIEQTSAWSQMGYTLEQSKELTKTSSIFATISPEMTTEESQEGLISVIKAYGIEAEDVLDEVASKVNLVGNEFAVTNSDVISSLEGSVSALAVANNTLDESIGLLTAGRVYQFV